MFLFPASVPLWLNHGRTVRYSLNLGLSLLGLLRRRVDDARGFIEAMCKKFFICLFGLLRTGEWGLRTDLIELDPYLIF